MIGNHTRIAISELRAVIVQVRVLEANSRFASRVSVATYAAFLLILLGSIRAGASSASVSPQHPTGGENSPRAPRGQGADSTMDSNSLSAARYAVQWRVKDGGNGHWYKLVKPSQRITMVDAAAAAVASGGRLCSIGSAEENYFVFTLASVDPTFWTIAWPGATETTGPWLGASYIDKSWTWIDGTSWSYTNWGPSEPNFLLHESAVVYRGWAGGAPTPKWNNIDPLYPNWGYMVEWSADCNNDGVVDLGQILAGEITDANGNNIPDWCE